MPNNLAFCLGIEGVDITAFLPDKQQVTSLTPPKDCGGANIQVWTILFGTIATATDKAGHVPSVTRQELLGPNNTAVI